MALGLQHRTHNERLRELGLHILVKKMQQQPRTMVKSSYKDEELNSSHWRQTVQKRHNAHKLQVGEVQTEHEKKTTPFSLGRFCNTGEGRPVWSETSVLEAFRAWLDKVTADELLCLQWPQFELETAPADLQRSLLTNTPKTLFKELYFGSSIQIAYEVFPAEKLLSAQAFSVVLTLKIYQSYKPVPTKAAVSLARTVQLTNYPNTTLVRLSQLCQGQSPTMHPTENLGNLKNCCCPSMLL